MMETGTDQIRSDRGGTTDFFYFFPIKIAFFSRLQRENPSYWVRVLNKYYESIINNNTYILLATIPRVMNVCGMRADDPSFTSLLQK